MSAGKGTRVGFWIFTALFTLQMGFTAYAQLCMPQPAAEFTHLGFPQYFRVELAWAKIAGLLAIVIPQVPARLKEWAYCGFAITLISAIIAHLAVGESVASWRWAAGTGILWLGSYSFWRRTQAAQ